MGWPAAGTNSKAGLDFASLAGLANVLCLSV
jgi:hypothetical protein